MMGKMFARFWRAGVPACTSTGEDARTPTRETPTIPSFPNSIIPSFQHSSVPPSHFALENAVDEDGVADHHGHADECDDEHHAERAEGR